MPSTKDRPPILRPNCAHNATALVPLHMQRRSHGGSTAGNDGRPARPWPFLSKKNSRPFKYLSIWEPQNGAVSFDFPFSHEKAARKTRTPIDFARTTYSNGQEEVEPALNRWNWCWTSIEPAATNVHKVKGTCKRWEHCNIEVIAALCQAQPHHTSQQNTCFAIGMRPYM